MSLTTYKAMVEMMGKEELSTDRRDVLAWLNAVMDYDEAERQFERAKERKSSAYERLQTVKGGLQGLGMFGHERDTRVFTFGPRTPGIALDNELCVVFHRGSDTPHIVKGE
jgi:hypothetical protein